MIDCWVKKNKVVRWGGEILYPSKESERHVLLIDKNRKKLEEMLASKNLATDKELVELSQELDRLIAICYAMKNEE